MSLFKKSNRKFKQRSRRESDDEDDSNTIKIDNKEDDDLESTTTTTARIIESKNVKLSFADDNDEDNNQEFKLKRSSSSVRALKQLSKKSKELKKSTKHNEFMNQSLNQTKSVRKYMETNKLENKDDNQTEFNQQSKIINLDDDELIEEEDDEVNDYLKFKKPSFKKDILIPDNKVIEEFKRRRFLAKEYISLNSTSPLNDNFDNDNKNSRLIREDPNDKESISIDDDDNEDLDDDRVNFYTDKTNLQKEKIKEAFFNAQNEANQNDNRFKFNDNKSSDDELDLWEQSQIMKGVGLQQQKEFTTNEIGNYLLNNQRNQLNNFEPPSFIKSMRPPLKKDKLLDKYKEELHLVTSKLDYLYNQFNNIELTINNLKETLGDN